MKHTKTTLAGMTQSLFMLAFFTVFWTSFMLWGFGKYLWGYVLATVFVGAAVYLLIVAIQSSKRIKTLSEETVSGTDKQAAKRWNVVFGLQGGCIGAVCMVLGILGYYAFIPPAVVLIVGIHYIPLGIMYRTAIHHIMAVFVILIAIGSLLLMLLTEDRNIGIGIASTAAAISTVVLGEYLKSQVKER
jgi:hypothetical protein